MGTQFLKPQASQTKSGPATNTPTHQFWRLFCWGWFLELARLKSPWIFRDTTIQTILQFLIAKLSSPPNRFGLLAFGSSSSFLFHQHIVSLICRSDPCKPAPTPPPPQHPPPNTPPPPTAPPVGPGWQALTKELFEGSKPSKDSAGEANHILHDLERRSLGFSVWLVGCVGLLVGCLVGCVGLLVGWLVGFVGLLVGWLRWLVGWSPGWLRWLVGWLAGWLRWLVGWSPGWLRWLAGWLHWLVGWSPGWLRWLVGWLVG